MERRITPSLPDSTYNVLQNAWGQWFGGRAPASPDVTSSKTATDSSKSQESPKLAVRSINARTTSPKQPATPQQIPPRNNRPQVLVSSTPEGRDGSSGNSLQQAVVPFTVGQVLQRIKSLLQPNDAIENQMYRDCYKVCNHCRDSQSLLCDIGIIALHLRARGWAGSVRKVLDSKSYWDIWEVLPAIFVGTPAQLMPLVQLLCYEAALSFEAHSKAVPPWRSYKATIGRWLSTNCMDVEAPVATDDNATDVVSMFLQQCDRLCESSHEDTSAQAAAESLYQGSATTEVRKSQHGFLVSSDNQELRTDGGSQSSAVANSGLPEPTTAQSSQHGEHKRQRGLLSEMLSSCQPHETLTQPT